MSPSARPRDDRLTPPVAARFAEIALGHVLREYPNKPDHVLTGPGDVVTPRTLHPIFYGSFDWHSCVHGYWLLARLRRLFPDMPQLRAITELIEMQFVPEKIAVEITYLQRAYSEGFERPYGWAWFLMLAAELSRHEDEVGARSARHFAPLAAAFTERLRAYLAKLSFPVRSGTHTNTAFALALAEEYATVQKDNGLRGALSSFAKARFGADQDCQAWEPSGEDFLSPALIEAECMRRLLPATEFTAWFSHFLPHLSQGLPATLFEPARVTDRSDGRIGHLDGLNLSRAWCWRSLARTLGEGHPIYAPALTAARRHLDASLPHIVGDFLGEHWLASFALLALEA